MPDYITVWITRTVRPGCEETFERAAHDFVQRSLAQPGQFGVHIIRPAPGSGSRDYRIVRKFASRAALDAFRTSPDYLEWNRSVRELTEGEARVEELAGLESWFTPPGVALRPLPKWKMALLTFAGVYLVTSVLLPTLGAMLAPWPLLARNAVFNLVVVACLTWLVMPILTRLLHRWLHSE